MGFELVTPAEPSPLQHSYSNPGSSDLNWRKFLCFSLQSVQSIIGATENFHDISATYQVQSVHPFRMLRSAQKSSLSELFWLRNRLSVHWLHLRARHAGPPLHRFR